MGASGLGQLLVSEGIIQDFDYKTLRNACGNQAAAFARSVLAIGLFDEEELATFLAEFTQFPRAEKNLADQLDPEAFTCIDPAISSRLEVLPFKFHKNRLLVAVADPLDRGTLRQLEFFSGSRIRPVIATLSEIRTMLATLIDGYEPMETPLEQFFFNHADAAAFRNRQRDIRAGHLSDEPSIDHTTPLDGQQPAANAPREDDYEEMDLDLDSDGGALAGSDDEFDIDGLSDLDGDGALEAEGLESEGNLEDIDDSETSNDFDSNELGGDAELEASDELGGDAELEASDDQLFDDGSEISDDATLEAGSDNDDLDVADIADDLDDKAAGVETEEDSLEASASSNPDLDDNSGLEPDDISTASDDELGIMSASSEAETNDMNSLEENDNVDSNEADLASTEIDELDELKELNELDELSTTDTNDDESLSDPDEPAIETQSDDVSEIDVMDQNIAASQTSTDEISDELNADLHEVDTAKDDVLVAGPIPTASLSVASLNKALLSLKSADSEHDALEVFANALASGTSQGGVFLSSNGEFFPKVQWRKDESNVANIFTEFEVTNEQLANLAESNTPDEWTHSEAFSEWGGQGHPVMTRKFMVEDKAIIVVVAADDKIFANSALANMIGQLSRSLAKKLEVSQPDN